MGPFVYRELHRSRGETPRLEKGVTPEKMSRKRRKRCQRIRSLEKVSRKRCLSEKVSEDSLPGKGVRGFVGKGVKRCQRIRGVLATH